ncbi:Nucleotidyltransferase superfamily [Babesia duncani]|uniref:Nucleotidyltransferase superfamily n=1 Tax=Babesia duncani TaxID=323732 RepID=A0AAD9UP46_9APIC|nr:Nucleotidyltransferase superfamily [Babesia duncani]
MDSPPVSDSAHESTDFDKMVSGSLECDEKLDRAFRDLGPEMYLIVDENKQRAITERNDHIRSLLPPAEKSKKDIKTNTSFGPSFIAKHNNKRNRRTGTPPETPENHLRKILRLKNLNSAPHSARTPFLIQLDIELSNLLEFLAPTVEELRAKEKYHLVLVRLIIICANVDVTGLSLPGGDVDIAIKCEGSDPLLLKLLVYTLNRLDLIHSFECVFDTPVPLIKVIDKCTGWCGKNSLDAGVKLDISMYQEFCKSTTEFIKKSVCFIHYIVIFSATHTSICHP